MVLNDKSHEINTDKWLIMSLPNRIEQIPRTCSGLKDLNVRLEKKYNDLINDMTYKLTEINTEIKNDIRLKSENVKHELTNLQEVRPKILNYLVFNPEKALDYDLKNVTKSKKYCMKFLRSAQKKINCFHKSLVCLENSRSEKFKAAFKEYYNKLISLRYKLPRDVQLYFENRILHTNQILLSNLRCYEDLKLELILQMDNEVKILLYHVEKSVYQWCRFCKQEIVVNVKFLHCSEPFLETLVKSKSSSNNIVKWFNKLQNDIVENLRKPVANVKEDCTNWNDSMCKIIEKIDLKMRKLIEIYYECNKELYQIHSKQIDDNLQILCRENVVPKEDACEFREISLKPFSVDIKKKIEGELNEFEMFWNVLIESANLKLKSAFVISLDYSQVVVNNDKKLEDSKKPVEKALSATANKQTKSLAKKEKKLSTRCAKLRQENTEKSLTKSLTKIKKFILTLQKTINSGKQKECNVVQKYLTYVKKCTDAFKKSLKTFVQKSQKKKDKEMKVIVLKNSEIPETSLIFVYMMKFSLFTKAVEIWKERLYESISSYISCKCDEDQQIRATSFMEPRLEAIEQKYAAKLHANEILFNDIQTKIYNTRLEELKEHLKQLEVHKKDVDDCIASAKTNLSPFERSKLEELKKAATEIVLVKENAMLSKNWLCSLSFVQQSQNVYKHFQSFVVENYDGYKEDFENHVLRILEDNSDLNKNALLFAESGNFGKKEAVNYRKKLNALKSLLGKKKAEVLKLVTSSQLGIKKKFDQESTKHMEIINQIHDIHKFQENFKDAVSKLKENIKKEVYCMKFKVKKLEMSVDKMNQLFQKLDENYYNAESSQEYIGIIRDHFEEVGLYLQVKDENATRKLLLLEDVGDFGRKTPGEKQIKEKRAQEKTATHHEFIFGSFVPKKEQSFSAKILNLLFNFSRLAQNISEIFYPKNIKCENYNIYVATPNEYCKDIVDKIKHYFVQCCQIWLREVDEYMELVKIYQENICQFCERQILKFQNQSKKILKIEALEVLTNLQKNFLIAKCAVKKLRGKLKSLHGYVKNLETLQKFDEEMKVLVGDLKQKIDENTSKFEVQKYEEMSYGEEITKIIVEFKKIMEVVCSDELTMVLREQSVVVKEILCSALENNDTSLPEIPQDNRISVSISKSIGNNEGAELLNHELSFALEVLTQDYSDYLDLLKNEVSEAKVKYLEQIDVFFEVWKVDVEKIKKLYTVKYD